MASPQLSAHEQLMLELINRARLDPAAEAERYGISINAGLAPGTLSAAPRAPLAWDVSLARAAAGHSEWMLAADTFSHTGAGGSSITDRIVDGGYALSGSWSVGENIVWRGVVGGIDQTWAIFDHHEALFLSAGHRLNILGDFREVGIAQEMGRFSASGYSFDSSMTTTDFGKTGNQAILTGVAYWDTDGDRFYDVGSGRDDVRFDQIGDGRDGVRTGSAGGYGLAVPLGQAGWEDFAVRTPAGTMELSLRMTGGNAKLDLMGQVLAASVDMDLARGARDARLLGAGAIDLTGNQADNRLWGGSGSNVLRGQDGDDSLWGLDGHDRLEGGDGADYIVGGIGNDVLLGGSGADRFVFIDPPGARTGNDRINDIGAGDRIIVDLQGHLPIERVWEDNNIDRIHDGWRVTLPDGSTITVWDATLSEVENALRLV